VGSPLGPTYERFTAQRRFAALDGLRCLAILAVIGHHALGPSVQAFSLGVGVDLSFAISGFIITTLLVREHRRTGSINVRRFYLRRTLRIFPLYFAVLGGYIALVLLTKRGTTAGDGFIHHIPAFATYTSNWFVPLHNSETIFYFAWSLATQEQFYLLWAPALLLTLLPGRIGRAAALMLLAIVVKEVVVNLAGGHALPLTVLRSIAPAICLGALWALVLHSPRGFARAGRLIGHRAAAPALLAAVAISFAAVAPHVILEILLPALVAACCIAEDTLLEPLLTLPPLVFVGRISYGMYLLHMLALNTVRPIVGQASGPAVYAAGTILTIAIAYVSFRWFESPILRRRDSHAATRDPRRGSLRRRARPVRSSSATSPGAAPAARPASRAP
jgi:peptidoglycan/LPS O-acetylase OafA/YrhL